MWTPFVSSHIRNSGLSADRGQVHPEEEKGEGKFYRKATPDAWREDLTPEHVKVVEDVTAPLLKEFYSER